MSRLAVIDSGTNTFTLYIYDLAPGGKYQRIHRSRAFVELAEEGAARIGAAAYQRAIEAYARFAEEMTQWQVSQYRAIGTAGLRTANNGLEFVAQVAQLFNIEIELIDGQREAELIYHGVRMAAPLNHETALLMDIGGGSVEFILANDTELFWAESYPIGISYLHSHFKPQDPLLPSDERAIMTHLRTHLQPLKEACAAHQPRLFVGSAGTMDTVYALHYGQPLRQAFDYIPIEAFAPIWRDLRETTYQERLAHFPIPATRAKLLPCGLLLLNAVLECADFEVAVLSDYALREGVLYESLLP